MTSRKTSIPIQIEEVHNLRHGDTWPEVLNQSLMIDSGRGWVIAKNIELRYLIDRREIAKASNDEHISLSTEQWDLIHWCLWKARRMYSRNPWGPWYHLG